MPPAGEGFVLGYDLGTSSVKAALFDSAGRVAASAAEPYPLLLPAPGWAEQRPDDWWRAMCAVTREVLAKAGADPSRVAAAGISAQMCGVVPVEKDGWPLANAIIWLDTRSSEIARRITGGGPRVAGYGIVSVARWLRLTGGAPNLSGKDPPSKMLWLREQRTDLWPSVHKLLDVKDYIVHRCTGRFVTSYDCAHLTWLFDARTGRKLWSPILLKRLGIDRALLPDIARASDVAGTLGEGAAGELGLRPGTPISVGLGDVSAAALAAGNAPHLYVGTSDWLGAMIPKAKVSPLTGIGSISGADGRDNLLIAAQESAGACVAWATGALGFGTNAFAAFDAEASSVATNKDSPLFLPWLYGERVPLDDRHVRGGFLNVSIAHGRADLARAVLEGVALNVRLAMKEFDRLAQSAGQPLRMVGGGANSKQWCQIFADVLQRPIEVMAEPALAGARAAAMTAAVAGGWYPSLAATAVMTAKAHTYAPNVSLAPLYAERFADFSKSYKRLKPWYAERASR